MKFYALNNLEDTRIDPKDIKEKIENLQSPSIILIRDTWNDYNYVTTFKGVYHQDNQFQELGQTKIITDWPEEHNGKRYTDLPEEFTNLNDKTYTFNTKQKAYFSEGNWDWYKNVSKLPSKEAIFESINDVIHLATPDTRFTKDDNFFLGEGFRLSLKRYTHPPKTPKDYYTNALDSLDKIQEDLNNKPSQFGIYLLYGATITTLEAFLHDAFKYHILNSETALTLFCSKNTFDKCTKPNIESLAKQQKDSIKEYLRIKAKEQLEKTTFHNLKTAYGFYQQIGIHLPSETGDCAPAIDKRHIIFHRNGVDKEGNSLNINDKKVIELKRKIKKVIKKTNRRLTKKYPSLSGN